MNVSCYILAKSPEEESEEEEEEEEYEEEAKYPGVDPSQLLVCSLQTRRKRRE